MKTVVVFASLIVALIVLSLFIVSSYAQYSFHPGHHAIPMYVQPAPLPTALIPTYSSYPSFGPPPSPHASFIPTASHAIPSYQPIMTAPVATHTVVPVPVAPVVIPQYNQYSQPSPSSPPSSSQIQERSSNEKSSSPSSSSSSGFSLSKPFSLPNDIADKLFPFTIRIATHGEPHMP